MLIREKTIQATVTIEEMLTIKAKAHKSQTTVSKFIREQLVKNGVLLK
jgi:hypothetical protein